MDGRAERNAFGDSEITQKRLKMSYQTCSVDIFVHLQPLGCNFIWRVLDLPGMRVINIDTRAEKSTANVYLSRHRRVAPSFPGETKRLSFPHLDYLRS